MKCRKCGEEYKEGQAFCLKCGNPIDEVEDMDIVEEDISSDVEYILENTGKFSVPRQVAKNTERKKAEAQKNTRKESVDDIDFPDDMDVSDYLPVEEIQKSVHNERRKEEVWIPEDDDDLDEIPDRYRSNRKRKSQQEATAARRGQRPGDRRGERNARRTDAEPAGSKRKGEREPVREADRKRNTKKKKRTGTIITAVVVVLVIVGVLGGAYLLIFGQDNAKFNQYYENAQSYFDKESWQAAVSEFIRADNQANTVEQKIKAKEMLWKTYEKMEGEESKAITVLENLIGLNGNEISYYEALLVLYQKTDNVAKIENLMSKVQGTEIGDKLEDYDFSTPVPSVAEGEYNEPISVELTSLSENKIYYTTNGEEPTEKSDLYETALKFSNPGEVTLKAIAINPKGIKSEVMTVKYKINAVMPPKISPESGDYTEFREITIEVPEGCTAYYTTDGTIPDKNSTEYKEPFDMPIGNTVLTAIIYNSGDVSSSVTRCIYNFVPYRAYSYTAALDQLKNALLTAGILENLDGKFENGSEMRFTYLETYLKDRKLYYIISTQHNTVERYAVSCSDGSVYRAQQEGDNYKLEAGVK